MAGHSSHFSLELIKITKMNVGVFSSFKHNVGLALNASSAGHVPTTDDKPFIVSAAWPKRLTPINLMSGYRKTGIHPLNPGYIKDRRQLLVWHVTMIL